MNTNFNNKQSTLNVPPELCHLLEKAGIVVSEISAFEPLTGGVASEVWLLECAGKQYCVKRALPKLKVEQDWQVAVERSEFEVLWFETVANLLREKVVPQVLASDAQQHAFVMDYFNPIDFPIWKQQLANGIIETQSAVKLAEALGKIHQYSARLPELAERFDMHEVFFQIRIEPYFLATAKQHPALASHIENLAEQLAATRLTLVHGDISPKNILIGKSSPIILDAECAVFSDPAFDLAFLLNHLLLKSFMVCDLGTGKEKIALLCESFQKVVNCYFQYADWEEINVFEKRVQDYLAVFLLARIDGKSPLEYIKQENDKNFVRDFSIALFKKENVCLSDIAQKWQNEFTQFKEF